MTSQYSNFVQMAAAGALILFGRLFDAKSFHGSELARVNTPKRALHNYLAARSRGDVIAQWQLTHNDVSIDPVLEAYSESFVDITPVSPGESSVDTETYRQKYRAKAVSELYFTVERSGEGIVNTAVLVKDQSDWWQVVQIGGASN